MSRHFIMRLGTILRAQKIYELLTTNQTYDHQ